MHSIFYDTLMQFTAVFFISLALVVLSFTAVESTPAATGELKLLFSNNMAGEHLPCG